MNVVVFIDHQNLYKGARDAYCWHGQAGKKGNVLPMQLARLLATGDLALPVPGEVDVRKRIVHRVSVYTGMAEQRHQPHEYSRAQRQIQHWEYGHDGVVKVKHRLLKYPAGWTPSESEKPREKGVDVMLAMDLVRGAIDPTSECKFDLAILVCNDTDLLPAVEFVIDQKGSDAIQTACPANKRDSDGRVLGQCGDPIRGKTSEARRATNRTIVIPEGTFSRVADHTDHNIPRAERLNLPAGRRRRPPR